jgi:hypothetical protein
VECVCLDKVAVSFILVVLCPLFFNPDPDPEPGISIYKKYSLNNLNFLSKMLCISLFTSL